MYVNSTNPGFPLVIWLNLPKICLSLVLCPRVMKPPPALLFVFIKVDLSLHGDGQVLLDPLSELTSEDDPTLEGFESDFLPR